MQKTTNTLCVFDMDHTLCDDYSEEAFLLHVPRLEYNTQINRYIQREILWPTLLHTLITKYPPQLETVPRVHEDMPDGAIHERTS